MSGGIDSSVAAKLLKDQGLDPLGVFLYFWKDDSLKEAENKCCSFGSLMDARLVCREIGIKLYTLNFSEVFKEQVVGNFLIKYKQGNTPNPCIRCNKLVKLGLLIKRAKELGFNCVASGHYIRLKNINNQLKLFRARDKAKDQSYFLYSLTQNQLKHLIFPLGDYNKKEVRKLAKKYGLPVVAKKESQEICFIPDKSHNEFLKRHLKLRPGPIKTLDNIKIGQHQGLALYTIGQRRGVEIGGSGPFYVVRKDKKSNTLYVVNNSYDPALYSDKLIAREVNWISGVKPKLPLQCQAVIRYRHQPRECKIEKSKVKQDDYLVKFKKAQRAVTSGQSVVFYKGEEMLGGGIIK